MNNDLSRNQLRRHLRAARAALTPQQQAAAAARLVTRIVTSAFFRSSRRIACYLPNDGEIDPTPLIERLWKFIKKDVLYARHYDTFAQLQAAIDGRLAKIPTDHREPLKSLMTHNFQTFDKTSFLTA